MSSSALESALCKVESTIKDASESAENGEPSYIKLLRVLKMEAEDKLNQLQEHKSSADEPKNALTIVPRKRKASEMSGDLEDDVIEDEDDDNEDEELKHEPTSEAIPRLPLSHPGFKWAEFYTNKVIQVFQTVIRSSAYQDREADYLAEELRTHENPEYGKDVKIGLIGDSGVGKSSLINSILGTENITVQADDGSSCTCVVMEFVQSTRMQKTPYAAQVEFFCAKSCQRMVQEMFGHYVKRAQMNDMEEEPGDMEELNAQTALECFCALFGNKRDFADEDAAKEYLATATGPDDTKILEELFRWVEDIRNYFKLNTEGDTISMGSNDVPNLVEQFLPFTKTVRYAKFQDSDLHFCPWPLVKLVRVQLNSRILKQGVTLADLPGVSDINQSRVNATNRYLSECDHSIVVARIDRAETEAPVHRHILESFRRRRSGSVMVVCTRSDDIGTRGRQTFQLSPKDEGRLNLIETQTLAADVKLEDIRKQIKEAKSDLPRVTELTRLKHRYEHRKAELEQEKTEIRIIARNNKVINGLSRKYRELTKDEARAPIFCVSNKVYMAYVVGYKRKEPPAIQLAETQIPALRSHIYSVPSKGKFAALEHYCQTSLETLLSTIQMSCSMSKLKRKDHLIKIVNASRENTGSRIETSFDRFRQTDIEGAMRSIQDLQRKWTSSAKTKCDGFARDYKAGAHGAFIRNRGKHQTKKNPYANWNEILLKPVPEDLDPIFDRLCNEECGRFASDLAQAINEIIGKMERTLRNDPAAVLAGAVKIFIDNLRNRNNEIRVETERITNSLKKELRIIHHKASTDSSDHYFTTAMAKIYTDAGEVKAIHTIKATPTQKYAKGKSKHIVRCEFFQNSVCAPVGPFNAIYENVLNDVKQALEAERENLSDRIDNIFKKIQHDFDRVCSIEEDHTPEGGKFRQLLHALVDEAREILAGPIKGYLDLCRQNK